MASIIIVAGTAAIGSIILIGAKSSLKFRGAASVVAALSIGTSITFVIGFKAIILNESGEGVPLHILSHYTSLLLGQWYCLTY
jgi:hypothetical protein